MNTAKIISKVTCKMEVTNWDSIYDMYKINLVKLFYNIISGKTPPLISDLVMWREAQYNLRGHNKVTVPGFSTKFMKHSIRFRGAVLWNFVSDYLKDSRNFKQFIRKVKLDPSFREVNFNVLSVQSVPKNVCDFIF